MDKIRLYSFCRENKIDISNLKQVLDFSIKLLDEVTRTYVGSEYINTDELSLKHFNHSWNVLMNNGDVIYSDDAKKELFVYFYSTFYREYTIDENIEDKYYRTKTFLEFVFDVKKYKTNDDLIKLGKIYSKFY